MSGGTARRPRECAAAERAVPFCFLATRDSAGNTVSSGAGGSVGLVGHGLIGGSTKELLMGEKGGGWTKKTCFVATCVVMKVKKHYITNERR